MKGVFFMAKRLKLPNGFGSVYTLNGKRRKNMPHELLLTQVQMANKLGNI